ncbi:MAG: N-acetylglucosamine-6-phosphate deacetylase [Sphingobacteriaceae bacterium]
MYTTLKEINQSIDCQNCITGETAKITIREGMLTGITQTESSLNKPFIGPGLIDLQVNGVNKIDFNAPDLNTDAILAATEFLISKGVTTYFPTVITNADQATLSILQTIDQACQIHEIVRDCIGGIHLEGPFISPKEGAKGAHDERFIKAPDWNLFKKFQNAAGGRIKIITLAPEWAGSERFIKKCKEAGILVSIGHSLANSAEIENAVKAGAIMSTHLGNAIPLFLPRHPNLIWDQLAAEELYTCLITDGIHLPDSFIKTVIKVKGNKALMISDATCFAGMPPGEYQTHIGGTVVLDEEKRVSLKDSGGLLAGAAKTLTENIETMMSRSVTTLSKSWEMASTNVLQMLSTYDTSFAVQNDFVIYELKAHQIFVQMVIKKGKVVFVENDCAFINT